MNLRELQALLYRRITDPDGTNESIGEERGLAPGVLEALVHGDERLSAFERVDIYANAYFYRLLVTGQEQLVADRAIRRYQVITWERHSVHHLVIFWNVGVQYPESADNFATDIREEWILDVVSRAECFENFTRVIGN